MDVKAALPTVVALVAGLGGGAIYHALDTPRPAPPADVRAVPTDARAVSATPDVRGATPHQVPAPARKPVTTCQLRCALKLHGCLSPEGGPPLVTVTYDYPRECPSDDEQGYICASCAAHRGRGENAIHDAEKAKADADAALQQAPP